MSRRPRRIFISLVHVAATVALGLAVGDSGDGGATTPADSGPVAGPPLPADAREAEVERVVDGDTVELAGLGKARIIGVDTPEVYGGAECYGREASDFTKRVLGDAAVRYTVGREDRYRYGRLLVYLWLAD